MIEKRLACCYTRFSTDMQSQSSTIGQLRAIKKYCEENNIEILDTYIDEAQSGTNMNRTNFQRMIEDSYHSLWKYIVVYNMSRLSRSVKDMLMIRDDLQKRGIKVLSVIEKQDETPEGDFFNLITYGLNELFVKQFKRDSWRGLIVNANECKALGGVPPLGYKIAADDRYVINENEVKAVKIIFKMVIEGYSYRQIANYLNENGFTNKGRKFSHRLTDILRNEKYTGVYIWNRSARKNEDGTRNHHLSKPLDEIIRIEGGMPQIISREDFERVQEILDKRRVEKGKTLRNSKYLLTGMIRCGLCGTTFCGGYQICGPGKYLRLIYKCNGGKLKLDKCKCGEINALYLESYINRLLTKMILVVENASLYQKFFNKSFGKKEGIIDDSITKAENEQISLKAKLDELVEVMRLASEDNYIALTKEISALTTRRAEIEVELLKLRKDKKYLQRVNKYSIEIAIRKYLKMMRGDSLEYKKIIHTIIDRIIVDKETIVFKVNLNRLIEEREDISELIIEVREPRVNIVNRFNFHQQVFSRDRLIQILDMQQIA